MAVFRPPPDASTHNEGDQQDDDSWSRIETSVRHVRSVAGKSTAARTPQGDHDQEVGSIDLPGVIQISQA